LLAVVVHTETKPDIIDPQQPVFDWKMVWNDEFDASTINSQNWTHEVNLPHPVYL
jgi:hypothetical protein